MPDLTWRKSTKCDSGTCVEVAVYPNAVYVRDSKLDPSPVLHYTRDEWRQLLDDIKADNELDELYLDGGVYHWAKDGEPLRFNLDEIVKFLDGAKAGEFDLPEVAP